MNGDIRIDVRFPHHAKLCKLGDQIGTDRALAATVRLWCWAALNRPQGDLSGVPEDELVAVCRWPRRGPPLIATMKECGFLDHNMALHDWSEHQPYVAHAEDRRQSAKRAADARWDAQRNAERMRAASREHDAGRNAPSPNPVPSPPESGVSLSVGTESSPPRAGGRPAPRASRAPRSGTANSYSPGFETAWNLYPHFGQRSRKVMAWELWSKRGLEAQTEQVVSWIEEGRIGQDWQKDQGAYVPGMQVWLRGQDFRDKPSNGNHANLPEFL